MNDREPMSVTRSRRPERTSPKRSARRYLPFGIGSAFVRPLLAGSILALLAPVLGCEREVTVVDPPDFFSFRAEDAWPTTCQPGARPDPAAVPPPPGLEIRACPNPAPSGATEIRFEFQLDTSARSVNLAIVAQDGRVLAELLQGTPVGADVLTTVSWPLRNVPPGDYRAYFLAGAIETSGDLRVE